LATDADTLADASRADLPQVETVVVTRPGDRWLLGSHAVFCGDSTQARDVDLAIGGHVADCILADPPYGMGKESDGVANDNLYRDKLDAFQMLWIEHALSVATNRASMYVWGNAPDLWRLWFDGGLNAVEDLHLRNELVWDKGNGFGMRSGLQHQYTPATERCLFFMRGKQFVGDINKADYWTGWDPLRLWLVEQRDLAGWTNKDVNEITGSSMAGHWFTKTQFQPLHKEQYERLHDAAGGVSFRETYDEVFEELFDGIVARGVAHRAKLVTKMRKGRTFFDNEHEAMTDVMNFPRVHGEERFGHATPKPVQMLAQMLRTSCPPGGVVFDPFLGTGTTLAAAEALGMTCFGLELSPEYVDVIVRRWQALTGKAAKLDGAKRGGTFAAVAKRRAKS
jgi:DNA modification methylase